MVWFHKLATNQLPAVVEVDVEGYLVVLQALKVARWPDWFEFRIEHKGYPDLKPAWRETVFLCRARRQQVVAEFCRRFDQWLREDYHGSEWPTTIRKLNLSALRKFGRRKTRNLA